MSCPPLETWLEALDAGAGKPNGVHDGCETCGANGVNARRLLSLVRGAAPASARSADAFLSGVMHGSPAHRRVVFGLGALAVATASLLLWARGEEMPVARGRRIAVCEIREVSEDGHLRALHDGDHIAAGSSLGFTFSNPGSASAWVGAFGISESGRVGWYWPAYESESDDADTVRLDGGALRTMPERVALPLGPGAARVVCWRSERPWHVRDADQAVEAAVRAFDRPLEVERVPALGGKQEGALLWLDESR